MSASHAGIGVGRENDIVVVYLPRGDADAMACHLRQRDIHTLPRYDAPGRASLLVVSPFGLGQVEAAINGWEARRS